jgi:CheY-like chemotaxis protein
MNDAVRNNIRRSLASSRYLHRRDAPQWVSPLRVGPPEFGLLRGEEMDKLWMVVEDDPVIRSILAAMMAVWEVQSLIFEDGHQAWEWLDKVERGEVGGPLPEVALLDLRLPGPPGPEIGQRMRKIPATSHIPIIVMTAYYLSDPDIAYIRQMAQPDLLLIKPLPQPPEFRELIERTIADRRPKALIEPSALQPVPTAFESAQGTD